MLLTESVAAVGILHNAVGIVVGTMGETNGMEVLVEHHLPEVVLVLDAEGGDDGTAGIRDTEPHHAPITTTVGDYGDVLVCETYDGGV